MRKPPLVEPDARSATTGDGHAARSDAFGTGGGPPPAPGQLRPPTSAPASPVTPTVTVAPSHSASTPASRIATPCAAISPEAATPDRAATQLIRRRPDEAGLRRHETRRREQPGEAPEQHRAEQPRAREAARQRQPAGHRAAPDQPRPQPRRHQPCDQPGPQHAARRVGRHQQPDHGRSTVELRRVRGRQALRHHVTADQPDQPGEHTGGAGRTTPHAARRGYRRTTRTAHRAAAPSRSADPNPHRPAGPTPPPSRTRRPARGPRRPPAPRPDGPAGRTAAAPPRRRR